MFSNQRPFLVAIALLVSFNLLSQITSDFTIGADGWTATGTVTLNWSATGGNPGGVISGNDPPSAAAPIYWYFIAPGKFLGNVSFLYGQNIRFDLQQSNQQTLTALADVILSNGTTTLYYYSIPNQPVSIPAWSSYKLQVDETSGNWKTANSSTAPAATQSQIKSVLLNLTSFQIRGRFGSTMGSCGLDNVVFTTPIKITSEPAGTYNKCEGTDLVLSADATGTTNIIFQWQKLNTSTGLYENLSDGGSISGATAKNFFITGIQLAQAGDYRCSIQGDFATPIVTGVASVVVNALPTLPITTGASSCGAGSVTVSASGASAADSYVWYYDISNGEPIPDETSATYTTPVLSTTTTYYVTIGNAYCETARVPVTATIDTMPAAPSTTGSASCVSGSQMLSASGGTNGQYRWYADPTIVTPISGETNSTYSTPSISSTTTYYVSIANGTCEGPRNAVTATITTAPDAPTTTGSASCGQGSVSLSASGGTDGQYRWYTDPTILTPISGESNSTYNTLSLNATTTYYVSIFNVCESSRTAVTATINIVTPPNTTGNSTCSPGAVVLTASGGANGQYRWYTNPTIVTSINGEVNSTFTTPTLPATTTYYVAINNGACESSRVPVVATITGPCNQPPAINTTSLTVQVQGSGSINLVDLLSDPDNNIDLTSLAVVVQPSSGATASIDNSFNLVLDYSGINFSGTDKLTIQVCDLGLACAQQEITIEVVGSIEVFNAISPNLDFKNDILFIQYIDILEATKNNKVVIFNRWGDVVWETQNYNNTTRVFRGLNKNGNELPTGVYYYKITFSSSQKPVEGFLSLKR